MKGPRTEETATFSRASSEISRAGAPGRLCYYFEDLCATAD